MKTISITPIGKKRQLRIVLIIIAAAIGFSYLYRHGVSPVWTAVAIVMFPGFFRFVYRVACFLVTAAILMAILSFLIF